MALVQPILYTVPAFDATKSYVFRFNAIGGDQVTGNILTIKNNATQATVYSGTVTSFAFEHTLPANTLTNGVYYVASIQTKNANGQTSVASNIVQFYCYADPSFAFNNISTGGVITNRTYTFNVTYSQAQSEALTEYVFNLYDANGRILSSSGALYTTSTTVPITVSYLFTGFVAESYYGVECTGLTSGGTEITTGIISFGVRYEQPAFSSGLKLENNCNGGYVSVASNVKAIIGTSNPTPPIYISNRAVDLTADGSWVVWDEGFQMGSSWTMGLWVRKAAVGKPLCTMYTGGNEIVVTLEADGNNICAVVRPSAHFMSLGGYVTASPSIAPPQDTQTLHIWVRQINNVYEVKLTNMGVLP